MGARDSGSIYPEDSVSVRDFNNSPRRSQSQSHRVSRPGPSNPFTNRAYPPRPDHFRSYSSDPYIRPLDKARREHRTANRAPHLIRVVPTDTIDSLDRTGAGGAYHHEGPYDATLASRQIPGRAPVEAVRYGNAQALAATPHANIMDSLLKKRPLQGVGMIAPGYRGPGGQFFDYEDENIMVNEGRLGRWPGVDYHPGDIKGKGEPGFSQDLQERLARSQRRQNRYADGNSMEMHERRGQAYGNRKRAVSDATPYNRVAQDPYRYDTREEEALPLPPLGRLGSLKKRLSLRRRK